MIIIFTGYFIYTKNNEVSNKKEESKELISNITIKNQEVEKIYNFIVGNISNSNENIYGCPLDYSIPLYDVYYDEEEKKDKEKPFSKMENSDYILFVLQKMPLIPYDKSTQDEYKYGMAKLEDVFNNVKVYFNKDVSEEDLKDFNSKYTDDYVYYDFINKTFDVDMCDAMSRGGYKLGNKIIDYKESDNSITITTLFYDYEYGVLDSCIYLTNILNDIKEGMFEADFCNVLTISSGFHGRLGGFKIKSPIDNFEFSKDIINKFVQIKYSFEKDSSNHYYLSNVERVN